MSESEFPPELVERCGKAITSDGNLSRDAVICSVLRESGHAELVAALKTVSQQYVLFVGPDDAIANATKAVVTSALKKAGAL